MIIYRYLTREILLTMTAVSGVLLLIIMSGRFVKYLAEAVTGKIAVDVLFSIMLYRLPGFIELILPLGFFIAILLAYGRMYMDSEMVVLSSCGFSPGQLLGATLISSVFVAFIVACMSFWIGPLGALKTENLLMEQRSRSEFTMLRSGYFQPVQEGRQVIYIENLSQNRQRLNHLFVAEMADLNHEGRASITVADYATQRFDPKYQQRYLQLHNGVRYEGTPGELEYTITHFELLAQHLPEPDLSASHKRAADAQSTLELMNNQTLEGYAALQWRISLPILVLVVTFLAVPLSRTNHRQGRYLKMLPAILLYMAYLTMLSATRGSIESGSWPVAVGLWPIHGLFIFIAIILFFWNSIFQYFRKNMKMRSVSA